jgi:hypothetical protein
MIHLQGKLPRNIYLACSGGVDSMAALDFLRRNHRVHVLHFDHRTAHSEQAIVFTDGEPFGSWGDESYCETLWIINNKYNKSIVPPFGAYAYYE